MTSRALCSSKSSIRKSAERLPIAVRNKRSGKSKQKKNPATRRWQGFNKYNLLGAYLVCAERTASRYTRPRKVPQDGQAMCGNASEPQFGQVTVCTADAFQLARRECVLAREVLYLGSAIIFLYFVQSIELKRSVYYSKRRTFSLKCSKNQPKRSHGLQRARYETRVGSPPRLPT